MLSLKNIFIQAKFEIARPLRSKVSVVAILLVFSTFALISFSLSSFSGGKSVPIGEYKIYSIGIPTNFPLAQKLSSYPRLKLSNKSPQNDLNLQTREEKLQFSSSQSEKSQAALQEVEVSLKEVIRDYSQEKVAKEESLKFILNPIWISSHPLSRLSSEAKSEERKREEPKNISLEKEENITPQGKEKQNITATEYGLPPEAVTPDKVEVPFIFSSILSSFVIIAPVFFFTLFFAASIIREKVAKKGTYLLASPFSPLEIILGKLLPYLLAVVVISSFTSFLMGKFSGWILLTVIPLTLALMGVALIAAILSKNPEDLNFTLLFINLVCFAYLFYPAMFSGVHSISLISPITGMIQGMKGTLTLGEFFWILTPISLLAVISLSFGSQLFQDEVLFTQRSLLANIYEGFNFLWLRKLGRFKAVFASFFSGVILIPLIYLVELGFLFLIFPLGTVILYLLLPFSAIVEEVGKILGVGAFLKKNLISPQRGWFYGALAGLGFFVVEKILALAYFGFLTDLGAIFLVSKSLFVHILCSGISGYGLSLSQGKFSRKSLKFIILAIFIHLLFNIWLMRWFL